MKELSTYIEEGFYKNVDADVQSTIDKWWGTDIDVFSDWFLQFYTYPDKEKKHYDLIYNWKDRCLRIHDRRHKTDRKDIVFDLVKEWGNCFSHLLQDTKDLGEKDLQIYYWIESSRWIDDEVWISVHTRKTKTNYIYRLYKGYIPVFRKAEVRNI